MQDKNVELGFANMMIASMSYINALDELKGTPYYSKDIKILVDQLLNKLQSKFKKQFKHMYSAEMLETSLNMVENYDRFNGLAVNEKTLLFQMADYYKENPDYWKSNFILFFEKHGQ